MSLLKTFFKIAFYLSVVCLHTRTHVCTHVCACVGQKISWGNWFSFSSMWVPETKLGHLAWQQTTFPLNYLPGLTDP